MTPRATGGQARRSSEDRFVPFSVLFRIPPIARPAYLRPVIHAQTPPSPDDLAERFAGILERLRPSAADRSGLIIAALLTLILNLLRDMARSFAAMPDRAPAGTLTPPPPAGTGCLEMAPRRSRPSYERVPRHPGWLRAEAAPLDPIFRPLCRTRRAEPPLPCPRGSRDGSRMSASSKSTSVPEAVEKIGLSRTGFRTPSSLQYRNV